MAAKPYPSLAEIGQHYSYDPETGVFLIAARTPDMYQDTAAWTAEQLCNSFNTRLAGRTAGAVINKGYRKLAFNGRQLLAHRVAFVFMGEPVPDVVDHINGDRDDNRWANLRACDTQRGNTLNRRRSRNNTSGFTGVCRRPQKYSCWEVTIKDQGRSIYLGKYRCLGMAIRARLQAEIDHGYYVAGEDREKAIAALRI